MGGALRDDGADINEQDREGWRPLHAAVFTGAEEAFSYLLRLKADVSLSGPQGMTPLHMAAKYNTGFAVQKLIAARANPDALDDSGQSVADLAFAKGSTAVLIALGLQAAPEVEQSQSGSAQDEAPSKPEVADSAAAAISQAGSEAKPLGRELLGRAGDGNSWFGSAVHPDKGDDDIDP
eukprot:617785-Amphidinium_carterae.1